MSVCFAIIHSLCVETMKHRLNKFLSVWRYEALILQINKSLEAPGSLMPKCIAHLVNLAYSGNSRLKSNCTDSCTMHNLREAS